MDVALRTFTRRSARMSFSKLSPVFTFVPCLTAVLQQLFSHSYQVKTGCCCLCEKKSLESLLFESAVAALIYQEKVTDAMKTD